MIDSDTAPPSPSLLFVHAASRTQCRALPASYSVAVSLVEAALARNPDATGAQALFNRRKAQEGDPSAPYVVPDNVLRRALRDLTLLKEGTPSQALHQVLADLPEVGKTVPLRREWQQEFAVWAFKAFRGNPPKPDQWDAHCFNQAKPQDSLSFLSGLRRRAKARPIYFVTMEEMVAAEQLAQLLAPPGFVEHNELPAPLALRYVEWLNRNCGDDQAYLLCTYTKTPGR